MDGVATTSTGSVREFKSPPLQPGKRYSYEVEVRWNEDGQERKQIQDVSVSAGSKVRLDFTIPSTTQQSTPVMQKR